MGALKYFFLFILSLAFATLFYRTGAVHHQHPPEMQSVINATHANVHLRLHHYVRGYYDAVRSPPPLDITSSLISLSLILKSQLASSKSLLRRSTTTAASLFTPLDKSSTSISPRTKRQDIGTAHQMEPFLQIQNSELIFMEAY
ncbi:hypothetical protein HAX54_013554 [Datura stramonium]|uniref:Uncharacterized protein n=1 Tax=Datura stramonium TaxID=4076 RepID=A0ABS8S0D5_DATST|nr:hypothetical protein [Datura stramonium]